ncbi:MAG: hypothetical protein WAU72_07725 [Acidimicrobiia bacterium]
MDASTLLGTIAQCSATVVAIIAGFLVSRLVSLSSEKESLEAKLKRVKDKQIVLDKQLNKYRDVMEELWADQMRPWIVEAYAKYREGLLNKSFIPTTEDQTDLIITSSCPRDAEISDIFELGIALIKDCEIVHQDMLNYLKETDNKNLELEKLFERGVAKKFGDELYEDFFHEMYDQLPEPPRSRYGAPSHHFITNMRWKPDSSVTITKDRYHSENRQGFRNATYENDLNQLEIENIHEDLESIAKPLGVVSGFWILAVFSLSGVLLPLFVMAISVESFSVCFAIVISSIFGACMVAVGFHMFWVLRKLKTSSLDQMVH